MPLFSGSKSKRSKQAARSNKHLPVAGSLLGSLYTEDRSTSFNRTVGKRLHGVTSQEPASFNLRTVMNNQISKWLLVILTAIFCAFHLANARILHLNRPRPSSSSLDATYFLQLKQCC
jgi:hypothetical protein